MYTTLYTDTSINKNPWSPLPQEDIQREKNMSSLPENVTCGVCFGSLSNIRVRGIFTAECSHSFHFTCITNSSGNRCPVCGTEWKDIPSTMPNSSASNTFFPSSFLPPQQPFPRFTHVWPQPQFTVQHIFESETFSDDEPLPENVTDPTSSGSTTGLEKVTIKAIPERPAVAASEFLSEFAVLVGLKAASLSDDAHNFQRAPIDLVTVLDVSGSMCGLKLSLMKSAVHFIIDNLGPSDRLSIVSFADTARRIFPLRRMIDEGRQSAKKAVDWLSANGSTNIVHALKMGVKVLEDRRQQNPVSTIIFLSDGNDTCNYMAISNRRQEPAYLHLLPASICPQNSGMENSGQQTTFPVHTFGFGTDHDPVAMHAIADSSGGTFSFIESYEMLQDAFASCIGGLLSVVIQDLCLNLRSASNGVEIKSISSGRYASETYNGGSQGILKIGDLYADEQKEFLINLSVPSLPNDDADDDTERKTTLLDITCSYRDVVSKEMAQIDGELVEIRRPKSVAPHDMALNIEVDRQRNRLSALLTITEAQQMAETGNLEGAQAVLSKGRSDLLATASAQAGDSLCLWLDAEMKETRKRMATPQMYMQQGRAYALSGMSSHTSQRAASRGNNVAGANVSAASLSFGGPSATPAVFGAYVTPTMANMVAQSQQQSKLAKEVSPKEK